MELLRTWIIGVTAASILIAVVVTLAPAGPTKKTVKFTGGLVLFMALVGPFKSLNFEDLAFYNMQLRADYENYEERAIYENSAMIFEIVKDKLETYVVETAASYGISCEAEISLKQHEDGYPFPVALDLIAVDGVVAADAKRLNRQIEAELGIPQELQVWR